MAAERFPGVFAQPPELTHDEKAKRDAEAKRQADEKLEAERLRCVGAIVAQIGARYRDCRFQTYAIEHDAQRKAVAALERYAEHAPERIAAGAGVVLFGPCGTGKDHLLTALAVRVAYLHSVPRITWISGPAFFAELRDRISDGAPEREIIDRLARADVLVISDPMPPSGTLTEYQSATMFRLVDARYQNRRPTWVSLNAESGADAEKRLGVATTDRLRDGALTIACNWPSHRKPWGDEV